MRRTVQLLCAVGLLLATPPAFAQTGKITGRVTEANTGDPLPGVNVVIEGTQQGTSTDVDGYYTIINIRPGTYDVRATFIGFTAVTQENVRVSIDLTSEVNFQLQEEAVGLEEIVVSAQQEVVKRDLSASRVDVTAEQIENLPVANITEVIGRQAGVQGLNIRGSSADEAAFIVDGLSYTTRRDNRPYTGVSFTAIEDVQIQSGGFAAKYGNLRSGIINVVTKEGSRDRYTADVILRYSAPGKKYFGDSPNDPNSYWMRPFTDPAVAFEGTDGGAWDDFTQDQFPVFEGGFNRIAAESQSDSDPNNDLTPEQAQEVFFHRTRRDLDVHEPDFTVDAGFGGPVPGLSQALGDLRFYASFRADETQYIIPRSRDGRDEWTGRLKLTSNFAPGMKLTVDGMRSRLQGTVTPTGRHVTRLVNDGDRQDFLGTGSTFSYGNDFEFGNIASEGGHNIFGNASMGISDIDHFLLGAVFTHSLSPTTFYEVKLQRMESDYFTRPPRERDPSCVFQVTSTFCVNEAPLGWSFESVNAETGLRMGGHWSEFRDTTNIVEYAGRFDFTTQVNRTNLVEAGFELSITPQDINYGYLDALAQDNDVFASWNSTEIYGAAYVQDKLEFRGMIANVGLRLDYLNPNIDWFSFDDPFDNLFAGKFADEFDELVDREPVSQQVRLSPRLGVSFPVTEASKLYFNYGHAYQRPFPEDLYRLERNITQNQVFTIANPDAPMQLSIQYELGYEQSFFDQYLVRLAGYYKDVRDETAFASFISRNGLVNYSINVPDNYRDTRGIEISLTKNAGRWIRGFLNYTFQVESEGNFGFRQFNQNRFTQRQYENNTTDFEQFKPLPRPFARFNIDFITPGGFGPSVAGANILADWRISLLGEWKSGGFFTFTGSGGGGTIRGVENNMQWKGYKMVDMRISRNVSVPGGRRVLLYADITNVFNIKNFNTASFDDGGNGDFIPYLNSLHLPEEWVEGWEENYAPRDENGDPIFGNDRPGDLDKDYIDPPNIASLRHLFPRNVFFGMRLTL